MQYIRCKRLTKNLAIDTIILTSNWKNSSFGFNISSNFLKPYKSFSLSLNIININCKLEFYNIKRINCVENNY